MLGHLNQSVYHEMLEEGRTALLGSLSEAFPFVLARIELDYRNEVRKEHDWIEVVTTVERLGNSSIVFADRIELPDGTVAAEGRSVCVAWDPEKRTKRSLSDTERAALSG
jgi:acyl-CoA thioester hydrolase